MIAYSQMRALDQADDFGFGAQFAIEGVVTGTRPHDNGAETDSSAVAELKYLERLLNVK